MGKRIHAHDLRPAYAAALEREGATIDDRDLLGHPSAAVTNRTCAVSVPVEAGEFARKREWEL